MMILQLSSKILLGAHFCGTSMSQQTFPSQAPWLSHLWLLILVREGKGPIFEDGPNFDTAFMLFHGQNGVVPLSGRPSMRPDAAPAPNFNPLAAKAATISLSAFGSGGPFGFDAFSEKWKKLNSKSNKKDSSSKQSYKCLDTPGQGGSYRVGFNRLSALSSYPCLKVWEIA